eukprot:375984-Pleurochrysis_carterae.AAC.1
MRRITRGNSEGEFGGKGGGDGGAAFGGEVDTEGRAEPQSANNKESTENSADANCLSAPTQ